MPDRLFVDSPKIVLSAVLVSALTTLASCASSTSTQRTESQPEDQSASTASSAESEIDHSAWNKLGYRWEWTGYPLKSGRALITQAEVLGDIIVTLATDTTATALETSTGKVRWAKPLDRSSTQLFEPVRLGDTILINTDTDYHELDVTTGNSLDKDPVGAVISTPPLRLGDLALMGTTRNQLIALHTQQDFVRWRYGFDGEIESPPIDIDGRSVAMISQGGDLRIIDSQYGSSIASAKISGGSVADMLVHEGTLYVASTDQSLYAFSTRNASRLWRLRTSAPLTAQPVIINDVLYTTTRDSGLSAINKDTGEMIWSNDEIGGWVVTILGGRDLLVWNGRDIMLVDAERGDLITTTTPEGIVAIRAGDDRDSDIYAVSEDGSISKFSPK